MWIRQEDGQASFLSMTFLLITKVKCQHTMGWFTERTAHIGMDFSLGGGGRVPSWSPKS